MTAQSAILPRFSNPPVVEVALSVMIEPLESVKAAHVGLLWDQLRDRFPKTLDQPPLDSSEEREFEKRQQPRQLLQFQPVLTPRLRTWFLNEPETELLQFQHDRVARNWRRAKTNLAYPSYDSIRGSFQKDLELVRSFLKQNEIGDLTPRQCEVTYVNHILSGKGWTGHGAVASVLRNWTEPAYKFLPKIEDATLAWRYAIREGNSFVGRLHVALQPAYLTVEGIETEVFVLTLTARGKPLGKDLKGALAFLDLGHQWIVSGFADITTPEMHEIWQRQV